MSFAQPSRRLFLRHGLTAAGAAASLLGLDWPEWAGGRPLAAASQAGQADPARMADVRVRGRVRAAGRGLPRVTVSDGASVVLTDKDGYFELWTPPNAFVSCAVPGEYEIATTPTGTARVFQSIGSGGPVQAGQAPTGRALSGQKARGPATADLVFDLRRRTDASGHHRFVVLADPQTQNTDETGYFLAETVPDVQALLRQHEGVPHFGIGCGDLMFDDLSLFPEYEKAVKAMGIPFFQVIGNHDLDLLGRSDEQSAATFSQRFGPVNYSFNVGAVHYVVLDDVMWYGAGYVGYVSERQLKWLEADLAHVERGRTVIVALHIPLMSTQYRRRKESQPPAGALVNNRAALYRLLEPFKAHVVSGHTHENENVLDQGVFEHVHGAVCGAWWSGPICHDGTPKGYGVFDVRGEDVRWTYKSTGLPSEHQLRAYGPGFDASIGASVVANVWNWDPKWSVIWVEDGQPRGPMERFTGSDPLSAKLHTGSALPVRRGWVEPVPTDHLFRCTPSANAREVRVEVTDRFGATFTETWRRAQPA